MARTTAGHFLLCAALITAMLAVASPAQTPAKPAATLADFAWLEGEWQGRTTGGNNFVFDETWSAPRGGVMYGMFRLVDPASNDRVLVLEFFTLRETPEGLELRLRHFDTALNAWEEGDPIVLKLVAAGENRYEFENFVHSSPKRATMTRSGADAFALRSEIIRDDGTVTLVQVEAQRVKTPRAASH